jgi:enoyl-CoA hydratase/carnithine racemase
MLLRPFAEYSQAYPHVDIQRTDGILELRLHTDGGPVKWGPGPHGELVNLYTELALDTDNEVVILTGTGDAFIDAWDAPDVQGVQPAGSGSGLRATPSSWGGHLHFEGKRIMQGHLEIEVPFIAAVNGPVSIHSEQALLCDIVLASETATFRDGGHFPAGLIPGDGVHIIYMEALGPIRGRYFLLTGQEIEAQDALQCGLVNEVVPPDQLIPRARQLARNILEKPPLVRRMTRQLLVQDLKKRMLDGVGYGLAVEGIAAFESFPTGLAARNQPANEG